MPPFRFLLLALACPACLASISSPPATAFTTELTGSNSVSYKISRSPGQLTLTATCPEPISNADFFVAVGQPAQLGARLVPFAKAWEGSTVFLPFHANFLAIARPSGLFIRNWQEFSWSQRQPAPDTLTAQRTSNSISLTLPASLIGNPQTALLVAYFKDISAHGGWGHLFGSLDSQTISGPGDKFLTRFLKPDSPKDRLSTPHPSTRIRIYQFLPRLFANTNETRKQNGSIEENGCGKFSDINDVSLRELKSMGFTHLWPTGLLQQATATDYSAIGEPADDPDILKGLAGSPYAIKDYFDVCPDYADNPANRLEEFRAMIRRIHSAGLKIIMDFVPNHVARSYSSTIKPELSFGANDDQSKFFHPSNNFYWLTPEARPTGKGPPLRLPTLDAQGHPISPTAKILPQKADGLFDQELKSARVTGNNLPSWEPDINSWFETVKLNYGFNFLQPNAPRAFPHAGNPEIPIPDTWLKMDEILAYWQSFGVDGFRVDMAHMVPPEFWQWAIARARSRNPNVFFAAEAYDNDPAKVPSADPLVQQAGNGNVMLALLNAGFDAVYDDLTYDKLKEIYDGSAWANDLDSLPLLQPLVFDASLRYAENHDEVRLAAPREWQGLGPRVGKSVSALLFALSRGPVMLYSGQEVGEPAEGQEGFGGDDSRTTIFDYWSLPELAKWVNNGKFDGGRLSEDQLALRAFYTRLLNCLDHPALRNGKFIPLNHVNIENPDFARLPGESPSGHWLYAFLRSDPETNSTILAVFNLHPTQNFSNVRINLPKGSLPAQPLKLRDLLSDQAIEISPTTNNPFQINLPSCTPLTPYLFEILHNPPTPGSLNP